MCRKSLLLNTHYMYQQIQLIFLSLKLKHFTEMETFHRGGNHSKIEDFIEKNWKETKRKKKNQEFMALKMNFTQ